MKKSLLPYSKAFERLQARFPGLSPNELAMWVSTDKLTAYPNDDAAYPHTSPVPGMSLEEFRSGCPELAEYEDKYGIRPFSFHDDDVHSIEDLEECFFDPEEIAAFAGEWYLTFQRLVERWQNQKPDIAAYIKRKAAKMDFFRFGPFDPLNRIDRPIEECLFALHQVEDREKEWFPAASERGVTTANGKRKAITDTLDKVQARSGDAFNRYAIPSTKQAFKELCERLNTSANFRYIRQETFNDYLSGLCRFTSGRPTQSKEDYFKGMFPELYP